eukprot:7389522-Prymnesium_polylepis.1
MQADGGEVLRHELAVTVGHPVAERVFPKRLHQVELEAVHGVDDEGLRAGGVCHDERLQQERVAVEVGV